MATIQTRKGIKGVTHTVTVRVAGHTPTTATFKRIGDAREWAARTETEIKESRYFDRRAITMTVAQALAKYLAEVSNKKAKNTHRRETSTAHVLERDLVPQRLLVDITSADVATYRDKRLNKPTSAYSVLLELALLSHLFRTAAREWGYKGLKNPVADIDRPPVPRGRTLFLTQEQSQALLEQCRKSQNKRLYPYVLTLLHTGMRPGEAAGIRWQNVHFDKRIIELVDTKNGDIRRVPMTQTVMGTLKRIKKPASEYVFLTSAQAKKGINMLPSKYFQKSFDYARAKAELPNLHMHDLRHTAASHLLMAGVDLRTLAAILGHRTMQMVMRYTHLLDDHKQAAIDKLDGLGVKSSELGVRSSEQKQKGKKKAAAPRG